MGFDGLLGNRQLKENLQAGIRRGSIGHFYLISGPAGSGKKTLARLLAAAILCREADKPCLCCPACRKVMADTHPDFITVRDPEHKNIAIRIIREVREEMFVLPNEADKKIYLLAQDMGVEGQNALLKILEEPPAHGVFILLTENPETLLPTVRSRCIQLRLQPLPEDTLRTALQSRFPQADPETMHAAIWRSGGFLGQAVTFLEEGASLAPQTTAFLRSFATKDVMGIVETLVSMERWKRDVAIPVLSQWLQLLQQALACRSGMPATSALIKDLAARRSSEDLNQAISHLQKAVLYAQGNVSIAAICGHLTWVLR